jgi:hypothetical protein
MAKKSEAEDMLKQAESAITARELMDQVTRVRSELEENMESIVSGQWKSKPKSSAGTGAAAEMLEQFPSQKSTEPDKPALRPDKLPTKPIEIELTPKPTPTDEVEFDFKGAEKTDLVWDLDKPKTLPEPKPAPTHTKKSAGKKRTVRKPTADDFKQHYPEWLTEMLDKNKTGQTEDEPIRMLKTVISSAIPIAIALFVFVLIMPDQLNFLICPFFLVILFIVVFRKLKKAGILEFFK